MWSLASRMLMAVVASFAMTILFATTGGWAIQQYGHSAPLGVLLGVFSPTTFFLSTTVLEYLEDGNIARSMKISLFYTGLAIVLIIALYSVAAMASPIPRLRCHQRPLPTTDTVAGRDLLDTVAARKLLRVGANNCH